MQKNDIFDLVAARKEESVNISAKSASGFSIFLKQMVEETITDIKGDLTYIAGFFKK